VAPAVIAVTVTIPTPPLALNPPTASQKQNHPVATSPNETTLPTGVTSSSVLTTLPTMPAAKNLPAVLRPKVNLATATVVAVVAAVAVAAVATDRPVKLSHVSNRAVNRVATRGRLASMVLQVAANSAVSKAGVHDVAAAIAVARITAVANPWVLAVRALAVIRVPVPRPANPPTAPRPLRSSKAPSTVCSKSIITAVTDSSVTPNGITSPTITIHSSPRRSWKNMASAKECSFVPRSAPAPTITVPASMKSNSSTE